MNSKLKIGQPCPLHRNSRTCSCHPEPAVRERVRKVQSINGVKKFPDGREVCSPAELRRRKSHLVRENPVCGACGEKFTDFNEVELAHRVSKGNGGFKNDSRWWNLYLMHKCGNRDQGSRSLEQYLSDCALKGVKPCQQ